MRLGLVAVCVGELKRCGGQRAQGAEGLRAVAELKVEKCALPIFGQALFDSSRVLVERRERLRGRERGCCEQREGRKRRNDKNADGGLAAEKADRAGENTVHSIVHWGRLQEKPEDCKTGSLFSCGQGKQLGTNTGGLHVTTKLVARAVLLMPLVIRTH